jgi:hypothetical protein
VVIERLPGGFVRLGDDPLPAWFVRVFIHAQGDGPRLTLTDVFPVLDAFLEEAEQFWDRTGEGRLTSEAFKVADSLGDELAVIATAVGWKGSRYLLLQPDVSFPERQQVLQRAREQALVHEQVVKQIQELRPPVASLSALAAALSASATDAQRDDVERLAAHVGTLQRVLGDLPQRARGASPRR